ncbi:MAG: hypothetical protein JJU02_09265 [Cryomorphaceae bacterium]|nr:hypothetical protein [Cryomorphaceae bacterium]
MRLFIYLTLALSFVFSHHAFGGGECCTVTSSNISELPNDSNIVFSVIIPKASYKMAAKMIRRDLRRISGFKTQRQETYFITSRFFWSDPMNDTAQVFVMILPYESGCIIHGVAQTDHGWVEPNGGSQASFFSDYLKTIAEKIHAVTLEDKIDDLRKEQRSVNKKLKKANKAIKKQRKKIVKNQNRISGVNNEITLLMNEQEKLLEDISFTRTKVNDLKGVDKKSYKAAKKDKKKLNKDLKKNKKAEEKLRKSVLDYQNEIRNIEEEILSMQDERDHLKEQIQSLQQKRRNLRNVLE